MRIIKPPKRPGKGQLTRRTVSSGSDRTQNSQELEALGEAPASQRQHASKLSDISDCSKVTISPTESVTRAKAKCDSDADAAKKNYHNLLAKGVRLLAMREHSTQEIKEKLFARTEFPELVEAVIDELLDNNYLCDERFTECYVRSRRNRGFGPVKIGNELRRKGISSILIDEHMEPHSAIWIDIAEEQHYKKYGDTPVSDYNAWTKRARFMQSRGFTMEHIQIALPKVEFD